MGYDIFNAKTWMRRALTAEAALRQMEQPPEDEHTVLARPVTREFVDPPENDSLHQPLRDQEGPQAPSEIEFRRAPRCCACGAWLFSFGHHPACAVNWTPTRVTAAELEEPQGTITRAQAITLCDKLEAYPFESKGGPLRLCVDWKKLRAFVRLA